MSRSCVSLPGLPTIVEEGKTGKRIGTRSCSKTRTDSLYMQPATEPRSLCAIFDFETFILDSAWLTDRQLLEKREKFPDLAITNMAVQEYTNKRVHTTITLIVLPPRIISLLTTARIPCLGKKKSIFISKYKHPTDGYHYVKLSTQKPDKSGACTSSMSSKYESKYNQKAMTSNKSRSDDGIQCNVNGMVFAIIFTTFPATKRFITNGVYYHGHGTAVYRPNFNGREKDLRACKPYDVFVPETQTAIKTLKPFRRKRAKSLGNAPPGKPATAKSKVAELSKSASNLMQQSPPQSEDGSATTTTTTTATSSSSSPRVRRVKKKRAKSRTCNLIKASTLKKTECAEYELQNRSRGSKKRSKSPVASPRSSKYPNKSSRSRSRSPIVDNEKEKEKEKNKEQTSKKHKKGIKKSKSLTQIHIAAGVASKGKLNGNEQSKRKLVRTKSSHNIKTVKKKNARVCGGDLFKPAHHELDLHELYPYLDTSIDSALTSSLSPIKESTPLKMKTRGQNSCKVRVVERS